jgi:hypothetical protein
MTATTSTVQAEQKPISREPFVVIPASLIAIARNRQLSGTEYSLWLYLYSLDPYGDRWVAIPSPVEISVILGVNPRTVEKAARRLEDCGLFKFQIQSWKALNCKPSGNQDPPQASIDDFSFGKEIQNSANLYKTCINLPEEKSERSPEPLQNGDSQNSECTNNRKKEFKEQIGARHENFIGAQHKNEQRVELITISGLLDQVVEAGVNPNKTIQKELNKLQASIGPAEAEVVLRKAISSFQEQQEGGSIRNPGGFIVQAIRSGYTANKTKGSKKRKNILPETVLPPQHIDERKINQADLDPNLPSLCPPSLDVFTVSRSIDLAIQGNDREWAINRLASLRDSFPEEIDDLLFLRRDWKIELNDLRL